MTTNGTQARRARPRAGLLALLLAAGTAGCDDFLSTEPRGQLTTTTFFQTENQAVQATNATYNMLRDWQVHVFSWLGMTDIVSDDATKGSTPADAGFLLDLENLNFDPGNTAFRDTWNGYYQGIYRANIAIQNIPSVQMDETKRARLVGENKFLRAYYYFFLVRAFGGVPLILEPLRPGQYTQPRATREAVYAQIEQDLTDAIAALPERNAYGTADVGRATKGAARALLAKVHLFQGEWQPALDRAREVINSNQYSLYPSYTGIFSQAGENSSESVFEVQTVALAEGGGASQYSEVQGVRGTPNLGWGFNNPSDDLEAAFEPGDPRLQATVLYAWEALPDGSGQVVFYNRDITDTPFNNQYNQKTFVSPTNPGGAGNSGVNIRRIRYADVLLIAAEAAARLGNTADAQNYLNQVRARARGGQQVTLGFAAETLAESVAGALKLAAGTSRVFVRYVTPNSAAANAGLRSFRVGFNSLSGPAAGDTATSIDLIEAVGGTAITTLQQFMDAVSGRSAGSQVTLGIRRVTAAGSQTLNVTVPVQQQLPPVTATGEALLQAILRERRVELAMEQHRWFDLVRQGQARERMAAIGKTFQTGKHEFFPIPAIEVTSAGLQQNPGYN